MRNGGRLPHDEDEGEEAQVRENSLTKRELLKSRLVCKRWRDNVDKHYQTDRLHLNFDVDPLNLMPAYLPLSEKLGWDHDGLYFRGPRKIKRFLRTWNKNTVNPFLVRCVEFQDAGWPLFWLEIIQFLRDFGRHVWYLYLRLSFPYNIPAPMIVFETVRRCLILVPNLKKLFLDFEPSWIDMIRKNYGQERITAYFDEKPLPRLRHLRMLSFYVSLPTVIHTHIMRCCTTTLKKLDFRNYIYDGDIYYPRLEEVFTTIEKLEDLKKLESFPISMKKILLGTVQYGHFSVTVEKAFSILHRFKKTLKEVFLEVQLVSYDAKFRANLPSLKKLTIRLRGSLDFLLNLKSLEYLDVFEYQAEEYESSDIKVDGFETKMLQSNIWEKLPSLQTLEWEGERFERRDLPAIPNAS
ncbi:unnamed protein product [Orchesella dallaii]